MLDWDAAKYHRVSDPQLAWARTVAVRLQPAPGERILDVGCGTGRLTSEIAARPGIVVVGLDRSAAMLTEATRGHRLPYVQADGTALPFAGTLRRGVQRRHLSLDPRSRSVVRQPVRRVEAGGTAGRPVRGREQSATPVRPGAPAAGIAALQGMVRVLVGPLVIRGSRRDRGAAGPRRVHRDRRVAGVGADHVRRRDGVRGVHRRASACGTISIGCRSPSARASSPT